MVVIVNTQAFYKHVPYVVTLHEILKHILEFLYASFLNVVNVLQRQDGKKATDKAFSLNKKLEREVFLEQRDIPLP